MLTIKYVKYVCSECGAEDTDKLFENEQPAAAIDCWSCHAGSKMPLPEMLMRKRGMFPKVEEAVA